MNVKSPKHNALSVVERIRVAAALGHPITFGAEASGAVLNHFKAAEKMLSDAEVFHEQALVAYKKSQSMHRRAIREALGIGAANIAIILLLGWLT